MKQLLLSLAAGLLLTACVSPTGWSEAPLGEPISTAPAPAGWWGRDVASVDLFYGPLAPHGQWSAHPRYGRVFLPANVGTAWQPYSRGYWRHDPRYGRTWVSSEPWGFATYHYGRWGRDTRLGWFWVPDVRFGGSWVDWRQGGGYASWSPLPPHGWDRWGTGYGNNWWVSAPWDWAYRPGMGGQWRSGRYDRPDAVYRNHPHRPDRNRPGSDRPVPDKPPRHVDSDSLPKPVPSPYGRHPRSDPARANPAPVAQANPVAPVAQAAQPSRSRAENPRSTSPASRRHSDD